MRGSPRLPLDAFDHRRLFAADVGARAPTQLDVGQRARRVGQQRVQLTLQQAAAVVVLVAQIEVDGLGARHLRGDQHAFEEAVRVALQVETVLEGAGLAFVDVDGHQARRRLLAHDAPLAPRREARAAQAAQAGVLQGAQHGLGLMLAVHHGRGQAVAAGGAVGVVRYRFNSCQ
jgi:hypothetical protein